MTRKECLDSAAKAVLTDRSTTYGKPEDSFAAIARMWSVYLGHPVSACDVACMLAQLKIIRAKHSPSHNDNWVDIAGYAAGGAECAERNEEPLPTAKKIRPQNLDFFAELDHRMAIAENKHPIFAEGVYQGIGVVTEEVGELSQAANKAQGEDRMEAEGWDVAVVAARFSRGDWKQKNLREKNSNDKD